MGLFNCYYTGIPLPIPLKLRGTVVRELINIPKREIGRSSSIGTYQGKVYPSLNVCQFNFKGKLLEASISLIIKTNISCRQDRTMTLSLTLGLTVSLFTNGSDNKGIGHYQCQMNCFWRQMRSKKRVLGMRWRSRGRWHTWLLTQGSNAGTQRPSSESTAAATCSLTVGSGTSWRWAYSYLVTSFNILCASHAENSPRCSCWTQTSERTEKDSK